MTPNFEQITNDRELVGRLLDGDEAAYDELFAEHFAGLMRFALSRLEGDEDLAQEMVQQTLVTAFERLSGFRGESTLFSWLCGICRFTLGDHLKRRRRRGEGLSIDAPPLARIAASLDDGAESPEEHLEQVECSDRVHEALDALPDRQGRALEWKYLEGLSVREIAHRLELGEKAAESLLSRARGAFRSVFARLRDVHPSRPAKTRPTGARDGPIDRRTR